jgi:serine-type D-Ala-D-Ala carboxypeptidase (penicillin-binding protein 5/6)
VLLRHPLRAGQKGFVITISAAEANEQAQRAQLGESTLPVRAGERLDEREALQALLLPSANNIAAALAAREAGGTKAFVAAMNATARGLGMDSTTYTDPSGFDDRTVSSAADQLKLARVAMREPVFAAIVREPSARLPLVGRLANYDGLVGRGGYVGVKTGSDRAAGGCLLFAKQVVLDRRRVTILGAVLGQREGGLIEAALTSARALGDSAAAALRIATVLPSGSTVLTARSTDGRQTTAVSTHTLSAVGWGGLTLPVKLLPGPPMRDVRAGQQMGALELGGALSAVTAVDTVSGPSLGWRLRHLL